MNTSQDGNMDSRQKHTPSFYYAAEMHQICKNLFRKMDINAFSYSKIYKDGSRTELWSDVAALEHSFFVKKHISQVYTPDLFDGQKFVMYDYAVRSFPKKTRDRIANQLKDQRELFNHANCLFVIDYQAEVTEYCAFYTPPSNNTAINDYLNHMDDLTKFRRFFRHRAKKIIDEADQSRLILPWRETNNLDAKIKAMRVSNQYGPAVILTRREDEVASLICEGMTAKEAAEILCVTPKTIEKHIENIKNKTGCNRRVQLINYLNQHYYEK